MSTTYTVKRSVLQAALICADLRRPELNCIWFDSGGWVVSTDPYHVFVGQLTPDSPKPKVGFSVPVAAIKHAVEKLKGEGEIEVTAGKTSGQVAGIVFALGTEFPKWRRCVPPRCSGKPGQYDSKYLGDFGRIAKLVSGSTQFHLHHNGESGPAVVQFQDSDCFGILMPYRSHFTDRWRRPENLMTGRSARTRKTT